MTLCHPTAFWSWPANWNHQLFSPAFLALPIGTYYRFSPAFWLRQSEPTKVFTSISARLTALRQFSIADKQHSSWWFYCEERLWRTSFCTSWSRYSRVSFRAQIRAKNNFDEWISYPPKSFSEVWLVSSCTKQQRQLYFFSFHHTTDKVQGGCRSRAKPPQYWFLPLHSVGTSSVVFSLLSKTRMDSSSSFLWCSKLTRCNPETCKLRDQLRFKEIFISTSQPRWRENVVGFNRSRRSRITDDAIKAVQRSCIYNEGYFCHNRLNQLASMLNNTADQLRNLLTSLVPVKVSWFGILPLRTIAMSLVIAWRFFQHYDFMSSNSFLVLTSKLEPSTVFTSIFGFANRNLSQVFTSFFGFANRNLWKVFTSISARLTALRQFSIADKQHSSWWFCCEERLWRTSFCTSWSRYSRVSFRAQIRARNNFDEWISYPPKSFSEVWLVSPCTKLADVLDFSSCHW